MEKNKPKDEELQALPKEAAELLGVKKEQIRRNQIRSRTDLTKNGRGDLADKLISPRPRSRPSARSRAEEHGFFIRQADLSPALEPP